MHLLKQLNVSSIQWLQRVDEQQNKYILLAKFIKLLFQYFLIIICRQFQVSYIKELRVFIHVKNFNAQKKFYMKKLEKNMAIEPDDAVSDDCKIKNRLNLIPKTNGLRPIIINKLSTEDKVNLKKALCVLRYLNVTFVKNVSNNFSEKYSSIVKENRMSDDNKIYIVSTDIINAYGSIKICKSFILFNNRLM
ncbi:uncharacterized protein LOC106640891 [Copidosoma floridanum]|uniref:uncharacterized protein LOC106640891 n=1 Tax=Copidosoma floridanum TaxID=29053 RepID=UPI0006C9999B|nr:uncharacterized protein LOC106640891 [Copidosoma floridanum]